MSERVRHGLGPESVPREGHCDKGGSSSNKVAGAIKVVNRGKVGTGAHGRHGGMEAGGYGRHVEVRVASGEARDGGVASGRGPRRGEGHVRLEVSGSRDGA